MINYLLFIDIKLMHLLLGSSHAWALLGTP